VRRSWLTPNLAFWLYCISQILLSSENHGSHFESAKAAFEEGAGQGAIRHGEGGLRGGADGDSVYAGEKDVYKKGSVVHNERVV
jgi:hypothetical protein